MNKNQFVDLWNYTEEQIIEYAIVLAEQYKAEYLNKTKPFNNQTKETIRVQVAEREAIAKANKEIKRCCKFSVKLHTEFKPIIENKEA